MIQTELSPARPRAEETPFCIGLQDALALIDARFGIERILQDTGRNIVKPYYLQSRAGFDRLNSHQGCMHIALNPDGHFDPDGYFTQIREISAQIEATKAKTVLELGSGVGFNVLALGRKHRDIEITGVDLLPQQVKTARKRAGAAANLRFVQASYEDLPHDLHRADLVFAIETLCHATDPDTVARQIAATLVPGGRFVMYDGFRRPDFDAAAEDVITAARLFEVTMAVTNGFWRLSDWQSALERAGLRVLHMQDLTRDSIPGMRRFQRRAVKFLTTPKYRILRYLMPRYMVRNSVAALTGSFATEGPVPGSNRAGACVSYNLLIAEKPV